MSKLNQKFAGASKLSFLTAPSLKTRMAIAVVALVLVTTALVTSVSLVLVKRGMKQVISEQQFTLLTRAADEIDQKFYSRQAGLQSLSANIPKESYSDPAWLQRFLEQQGSLKSLFDNLLVFDAHGMVVANLNEPASRNSANLASRRYIKDTLALRKGVISAPLRNALTQRSIVTLTTPVLDLHGQVVLILVGFIDLEQDNFLGQLARMKIGQTGYFYIVTSDGTIVTHPNKSRILQNVAAVEGYNPALDLAFTGFEGTTEGSNRLSANGLLSFKRLKSANWIIGAAYPEAEIFAPIAEVENRAIMAAVILAILVGPLAWWITRRQISPLQQLRDRIQEMREDPASAMIPVKYRRDEIGDLAQAFDRLMRERLFAEARAQTTEAELRAATDSSLDAFFIFHSDKDETGRIVDFRFMYLNANAEHLIGMAQQELLDTRLCDVIPVMRADGWFDQFVHVVETRRPMQEEFAIQAPNIRANWLHIQVVPIADGVAVTMRDITERKRGEAELRDNRAFLQSLIEYLPVLIFAKSFRPEKPDQLVVWNKAAEVVMGYPASKVIGKSNHEIFPPKVAANLNELDRQMLADPKVVVIPELPYRRPDGAMCFLHSTSVPLFGENGQVDYILGIVEDITARRETEHALRKSQKWLRMIADNLPALIAYVDHEERYRFCNSYYESVFSKGGDRLLGRSVREVLGDEAYGFASDRIARALQGERISFERQDMREDGITRHWRVEYIPDQQNGKVVGFYAMVLDITELKLVEHKLRILARTDSLTGLANRNHFDERLTEAIARNQRTGLHMALLYLDIDHFKSINDSLGHHGGDEVLREFGRRLTSCVRQTDAVARLAGDEFVIIVEGLNVSDEAVLIARKVIDAMEQGFDVLETVRQVTTSIGIAIRREGEMDAEELLRRADKALYMAKSSGRNTFKSLQ